MVQQVHCSRRRSLRRGLEFHVCTINKSTHTKKSRETYWRRLVCCLQLNSFLLSPYPVDIYRILVSNFTHSLVCQLLNISYPFFPLTHRQLFFHWILIWKKTGLFGRLNFPSNTVERFFSIPLLLYFSKQIEILSLLAQFLFN